MAKKSGKSKRVISPTARRMRHARRIAKKAYSTATKRGMSKAACRAAKLSHLVYEQMFLES